MIVSDLIIGTRRKLAGRTDQDQNIPLWIKAAILELTENFPFEELKVTGPVVNFVIGQSQYAATYFTNGNEKATQLYSWFRWNNSTPTSVEDTSVQGMIIKFRTMAVVEPMTKVSAPPTRWTRWGSNNVIVGNNPDQAYSTYWRYQRAHYFPPDTDITEINATEIKMPDSWQELIEYAAAMRGAWELRMLDYAGAYKTLLYGDPKFQISGTDGQPGLIFQRTSQFMRDASNNERALQPIVLRS